MVILHLLVLTLGVAAATAEELFSIPGFDPSEEKEKFEACIKEASQNFTDKHADDKQCPNSCLMCIHDPKTCPFKCIFGDVCGCGKEIPELATVYIQCCALLNQGVISAKGQCEHGLHRLQNKALRSVEWECGQMSTTQEPDGCNKYTKGSCAWWKCDSSRNAVCDTQDTFKCMCEDGYCAVDGACTPKSSPEGSQALATFTELMMDIQASTTLESLAPDMAQVYADLERLKESREQLGRSHSTFPETACGLGAVAALTTAVVYRVMRWPRKDPQPIDALG